MKKVRSKASKDTEAERAARRERSDFAFCSYNDSMTHEGALTVKAVLENPSNVSRQDVRHLTRPYLERIFQARGQPFHWTVPILQDQILAWDGRDAPAPERRQNLDAKDDVLRLETLVEPDKLTLRKKKASVEVGDSVVGPAPEVESHNRREKQKVERLAHGTTDARETPKSQSSFPTFKSVEALDAALQIKRRSKGYLTVASLNAELNWHVENPVSDPADPQKTSASGIPKRRGHREDHIECLRTAIERRSSFLKTARGNCIVQEPDIPASIAEDVELPFYDPEPHFHECKMPDLPGIPHSSRSNCMVSKGIQEPDIPGLIPEDAEMPFYDPEPHFPDCEMPDLPGANVYQDRRDKRRERKKRANSARLMHRPRARGMRRKALKKTLYIYEPVDDTERQYRVNSAGKRTGPGTEPRFHKRHRIFSPAHLYSGSSWNFIGDEKYAKLFGALRDTSRPHLSTAFQQALNYSSFSLTVDCVIGRDSIGTTSILSVDVDGKLQESKPLGTLKREFTYLNNPEDLKRMRLEDVIPYLQTTTINIAAIPWPVEPDMKSSLWPLEPNGDLEAFERSVQLHGATQNARELREVLRVFHPDRWPKAEMFPELAAGREGTSCASQGTKTKKPKYPWEEKAMSLPPNFVRNLTERLQSQDAWTTVWPEVPARPI
ncbi:hypothetical protein B0H11DRAFT_1911784 [Mycena galericulata]|nr:hypothetical protein B0H11DRAFT_1911784 [Mycena galericulata]